jgi:hypothetical protein
MSRSPISPNHTMQAVLPESALFSCHFSDRFCGVPCVKESSSFSRREAASINCRSQLMSRQPSHIFNGIGGARVRTFTFNR